MVTFEAKIGWRTMRKRKYKNYSSVPFLSDTLLKIPKKNSKIIKKIKKYHYGFILSQNRLGTDENE